MSRRGIYSIAPNARFLPTLVEGVLRAAESIDSGAARTRLERLISLTRAGVAA